MSYHHVGSAIGSINSITPITSTVVFSVTLLGLVIVAALLDRLYAWAAYHQKTGIIRESQGRVLIFGLVSFSIFILDSFANDSRWLIEVVPVLHFVHVLNVAMTVAYLFMVIFIILFVSDCNKRLLRIIGISIYDLKTEFNQLSHIAHFQFRYIPEWLRLFGLVHPVRSAIDINIFRSVFMSAFQIDAAFSYSKYLTALLQSMLLEYLNLSSLSWFLLAAFACVNYIRVHVIKAQIPSSVACNDGGSTMEMSEGLSCDHYSTLCFSLVCGSAFAFALLVQYYYSSAIYCRFVALGMRKQKANPDTTIRAYEKLVRELTKTGDTIIESEPSKRLFQQCMLDMDKAEKWNNSKELKDLYAAVYYADSRKKNKELLADRDPWYKQLGRGWSQFTASVTSESDEINELFPFRTPYLYFVGLNVSVAAQCVYAAVCFTQLLSITHSAKYRGAWVVLLLLPIIVNLVLFRLCLYHAVLFRSMLCLEKSCLITVLENILSANSALAGIRATVNGALKKSKLERFQIRTFVCKLYSEFDADGDFKLSQNEFRIFLAQLNVYLNDSNFRLVWKFFDTDLSGSITWEEMYASLFPEHRVSTFALARLVDKFSEIILDDIKAMSQADILRRCFIQCDTELSGSIPVVVFIRLMDTLKVGLPTDSIRTMLAAIGSDGESVTWEQFLDVVLHPCKRQGLRAEDYTLELTTPTDRALAKLRSVKSIRTLFGDFQPESDSTDSRTLSAGESVKPGPSSPRRQSLLATSTRTEEKAENKPTVRLQRRDSGLRPPAEIAVGTPPETLQGEQETANLGEVTFGDIYGGNEEVDEDDDLFNYFSSTAAVRSDNFAV